MIDPQNLGNEIAKRIVEAIEEVSDKSSFDKKLDEIVKDFINEASLSNVGPDDGPGFVYPNYTAYKNASVKDNKNLLDTGWEIVDYLLDDELEQKLDAPTYPNGPVNSTSFFPAGDIGVTTPNNQKDIYGVQAYNKWKKHVMNMLKSLGWEFAQSKQQERLMKKVAVDGAKDIKNQKKEDDKKHVTGVVGLEEALSPIEKHRRALKQAKRKVIAQKKRERTARAKKSSKQLFVRAHKQAYNTIYDRLRKKLYPESTSKADLSLQQKKKLEIKMKSKGAVVQKLATKVFLPQIKQKLYGEGLMNEIPYSDLKKIDNYADSQFNPIDIVITDRHFFDRLQDPRNQKEISAAELIGFFKRLAKKKKQFIDFLQKYNQIVATDNRTKINIPFMQLANKAIAKTVMRKDNFKSSNPSFTFENKEFDKVKFYEEFYKNLTPTGFRVASDGNIIKIELPIESINEDIKIPVKVGDTILTGRFKNKKVVVKSIGKDEHGMPTVNGKKVVSFRLVKEGIEKIVTLPDSLGISRNKMPQIKSDLMGDYINYINDMGVRITKKKLPISTLKNTQGELSKDKIKGLLKSSGKQSLEKPFIISSDNYILDGHHRANALYNIDDRYKANVIQVNLPIKKLIQVTHDFDKVKYKSIDELSMIDGDIDLYIEDTPYAGILENEFIKNKNVNILESAGLFLNESVSSNEEIILEESKDLFSEMVIQQTLGILSESGALPGVVGVPSGIADKVVGEFIKKVLQPLNIVRTDSVVGLGSTRAILRKLPTAKKISGDLDLLAIAKTDSRSAVSKLVDWAKKKNYDYQVAFGNIFSVAYPYGDNKYQVDLMIAQPSEDDVVYSYMRKFKYFSDEDPNQSGDFIIKGAHRSELAKTIVKAMGLSAAESGFKQFKWNNKYSSIEPIADKLEKSAARFRDEDKKQQTLGLVDLLRNRIKDISKLKKELADADELLKDRYPSALFKKYPKAYDLMIDMLFDKENTPETWEKVLDRKFKVSNAIERMNKFEDVLKIVQELLKKRLITPRAVLGVFTEMKKNFDTGKAAARWNRTLEEYIESYFPFLKNRW